MTGEERVIRITAPWFVAGVVLVDGRVTRAAPIVAYMRGWHGARVLAYARRKGWRTTS